MARIRTIKPEFWTSEQVMECSLNARLLFVGMWNFADDHGRMPVAPKTIKAQVFPGDDLSIETIRGMISELSANGLILMYVVDGKEYLEITGWKHQRIDKPQKAKHPGPLDDGSKTIPRTFDVGMEKEGKGEEGAASAAPPPASGQNRARYRRCRMGSPVRRAIRTSRRARDYPAAMNSNGFVRTRGLRVLSTKTGMPPCVLGC